jgi:hypothetical protein
MTFAIFVATHLLTAGVDLRTVAGRLGHRKPGQRSTCTPRSFPMPITVPLP